MEPNFEPLGRLLERLGHLLERLGRLWERLGQLLDVFGAQLAASWAPLAASWAPLRASWAALGASWAPLGAHLGAPGDLLGPTWRLSDLTYSFLGAFGTPLGPSNWPPSAPWTPLGPCNSPPSTSWTPLGPSNWRLSATWIPPQRLPLPSEFFPPALQVLFKCTPSVLQLEYPKGCHCQASSPCTTPRAAEYNSRALPTRLLVAGWRHMQH